MIQASTFKLCISVPRLVQIEGHSFDRETFYLWLWNHFEEAGLLGVHEGTLLSEEAHEQGFETDSFTIDAAEAPRERDWIGSQELEEVELFFDTPANAEAAGQGLRLISELQGSSFEVVEVQDQDWDAEWKASFQGVRVPPFWSILPPWVEATAETVRPGEQLLRLNPGAGFGTGTHETTQLCLEFIGILASEQPVLDSGQPRRLKGWSVLDFGSGSGILSIGAALMGAKVDACEIDPLANDNAHQNAHLNDLGDEQLKIGENLGEFAGPYQLVIANILKPVLLGFAVELMRRRMPKGSVILSGLMEADVAPVIEAYRPLLGGREPEVKALGEWRAVFWR